MANRNKYELTPKGKIGLKKQEIIQSGNIVDINDNDIHEIMKEYEYDSYDIKLWGTWSCPPPLANGWLCSKIDLSSYYTEAIWQRLYGKTIEDTIMYKMSTMT